MRPGAAYTASKHALTGLTKNTAVSYYAKGIRCNQVLPSGMVTNIGNDLRDKMNLEGYGLMKELNPLASGQAGLVNTEDVAALVLFLTTDHAKAVNGQIIAADKGTFSAT
jgi:NAD(P)-dependent dehydrogenase (short-subunit alcohol dehydrogenase family)